MPAQIERGCGVRIQGAAYWVAGSAGIGGAVVENFIVDPPVVIDEAALGLSAIGTHPVMRNGVTHLLDWVGSGHYPYVSDFVEEARRYGISRRLSAATRWDALTPASRLLLVHRDAWIENWQEMRPVQRANYTCPRQISNHERAHSMCAGLWWEQQEVAEVEMSGRQWRRQSSAATSYQVRWPRNSLPITKSAIFMSVPLTRIEVVADTSEAQSHARLIGRIQAANGNRYPVTLVNY